MTRHLRLKTDFSNYDLAGFDFQAWQNRCQGLDLPAFQKHVVDTAALAADLEPYYRFKNVILIGNGGSRTSALALYRSLVEYRSGVRFEFLSTMEPGVIASLKKEFPPQNTLVMPVSKSGTNVDVLEPLLQFLEYTILPITDPAKGVLAEIARRRGWKTIPHPEVGGRYSGRTECGLAPAALMGLPIEKIDRGATAAYEAFDFNSSFKDNIAFRAALVCREHEALGMNEIFMPIYSERLAGFLPLIIQLVHESTGKNNLGQTVFGDQAPESQHHTNQRFFGGQRNVMGFFVTVAESQWDIKTFVPDQLRDIPFGDATVGALHGIPLSQALRFDYEGVAENAAAHGIPFLTLEVDTVTPESVGEFLSFWHYFTVYSALLREQNPYDQPEVEASKAISFKKRQGYHH